MWLAVAVLLPIIAADPNTAEDQFRAMEKQVLKCKTLQTQVEFAIEPGKDDAMKGRVAVASGNKVRIDLGGAVGGKSGKILIVSDGTKMKTTNMDQPPQEQDAPKQLAPFTLAAVSRAGIFVPLYMIVSDKFSDEPGKKPKDFDIDQHFKISDFKLGKKEMVGAMEAQAVEYKLMPKGANDPLSVTVWIDAKTNLPVKRVVMNMEKDKLTITETYTKTTLDEEIDDKQFELLK